MKLNKFAKIIIISILFSLVASCSRSGAKLNNSTLARVSFYPESGEVSLRLYERSYLKQSFVDSLEENPNIEFETTYSTLHIYFDTVDSFSSWSIEHFDGELLKYTNIDTLFFKYENIKFDNKLFYENKYNIYNSTPIDERVIELADCGVLDLISAQCYGYEAYVYVLKDLVFVNDDVITSNTGIYEKTEKDFGIELIDKEDQLDDDLDKNITESTSYKNLKVKWITYIFLIVLTGLGAYSLYQYLSVKYKKPTKKDKEENDSNNKENLL